MVPLPLRAAFGDSGASVQLAASLEPEGCIGLRSIADWTRISDAQFRAARSPSERTAASLFANFSQIVTCDRQGRLRLSDELLNRAGISHRSEKQRMVIVVGQQRMVRVWSRVQWDELLRVLPTAYSASLDELRNRLSPEEGGQA